MQLFQELGRTVNQQWKASAYDPNALPDLAVEALNTFDPAANVDTEAIARWAMHEEQFPRQVERKSRFGQPPLTLYADERLYILALFWLDSTTAIHQHSFTGAFQVFEGSSIHSVFSFEEQERLNASVRVGHMETLRVDHLTKGMVQSIAPGSQYIHSLFHLEYPSVTIVVRSYGVAELQPQWRYLAPSIAIDDKAERASTQMRRDLFRMLALTQHPALMPLVEEWIQEADVEEVTLVLWKLTASRALRREDLQRVLELLEAHHPELARHLVGVLVDEDRRAQLISRRGVLKDAKSRLMMGLLATHPSREEALQIIRDAYPEEDMPALVMGWIKELTQAGLPPQLVQRVMHLFSAAPKESAA